MSLKVSLDKLKFDKRMTDINIKSRSLSSEDFNKHLEKLPDLESVSSTLELEAQQSEQEQD